MLAKEIMESIAKKIKEKPDRVSGVSAVIAIELSGDSGGRWVVDCKKSPAEVREDKTTAAEMTIIMAVSDMEKMMKGDLSPQTAFLTGKVKVDGDLSLALKLGEIFG